MANLFSEADKAKLRSPHIARAWFGEFDLPSGSVRLHNGCERVTVGGYEWTGVSDPVSGQLVDISGVQNQRFGQAASVNIVIASPTVAFMKSVKADARAIEGRRCDLWFAVFDQETFEVILFKKLFPGKMSAPSLVWAQGVRAVSITVESMWQAFNYPFGGKWNDADQRRRYPGDKGGEYIGVDVAEVWT